MKRYFTVREGYKIQVRNTNKDAGFFDQFGVLNSDFRFSLAGEINYLDMLVYINVENASGVWTMSLFDWEKLVITKEESDKKFLEGLYDGENVHLFGRGTIRE